MEDAVDHDGERFHFEGVRVLPKPAQQPPDVWLGGFAASELRRVGRLADGWLPSFVQPADAAAGRLVVDQTADAHGRTIDPEHFGALIPYATADAPVPDAVLAAIGRRRPDLDDPSVLIPNGIPALRDRIGGFVDAGFRSSSCSRSLSPVPTRGPITWRRSPTTCSTSRDD